MLKKVRNLFFAGILVILPLVVTIYILWYLFIVIDNVTSPIVELILHRDIPGVGLIFTFLIILISGILATNIIGRKIIHYGEGVLLKIPFFCNIYVSIKRVLEGLFTSHKESFKKAVLFEYPRKGLYQIGFITKETSNYFDDITGEQLFNVFLPTTPNPTSGMFVLIPKKDAVILEISIEEALKLIISGGILTPESPDLSIEDKNKVLLNN